MHNDLPFFAINTDEIEWDKEVTLFHLPTGPRKTDPKLRVKVLMRDHKSGQVAAIVKFPPGFAEPPHEHVVSHCVLVLEGEQHVAGKVLKKGDFHYAPSNVVHGPFAYPVGATIFGVWHVPPSVGSCV